MSTAIDPALVARLSGEFTALGVRMGQLGGDLDVLSAQLRGEVSRAGSSEATSSGSDAEHADSDAVSGVPGIGVGEVGRVGMMPEPRAVSGAGGAQSVAGQAVTGTGHGYVGPVGGVAYGSAGWPVGARYGGQVGAGPSGVAPNWVDSNGMPGGPATSYRAAGPPPKWVGAAGPQGGRAVPYGQVGQPAGWAGTPGRGAPGWVGSSGSRGQFGPGRTTRVPWWRRSRHRPRRRPRPVPRVREPARSRPPERDPSGSSATAATALRGRGGTRRRREPPRTARAPRSATTTTTAAPTSTSRTCGGRNRLYRNNGDGTFTDVAADAGRRPSRSTSFATWFFDYDNDGWLDLFVADYGARGARTRAAHSYLGPNRRRARRASTATTATARFRDVTARRRPRPARARRWARTSATSTTTAGSTSTSAPATRTSTR